MMYRFFSVLILTGLFLLVGCGKDDDPAKAVEQEAREPRLMQTWEGPCKIKIFDKSARQILQFSGSRVNEGYVLYEDNDCKKGMVQLQYNGDLTIPSEPKEGVRPLDLQFTKAILKPLSDGGAEFLDKTDACGVEDWKKDQVVEITDKERGVKCPFRKLPEKEFNTFLVEKQGDKDILYLGKAGLFQGGELKDPADRPKNVDKKQPFTRSEYKF